MNDPKVDIDFSKIARARDLAIVEGLNASQLLLSSLVRAQLSKPGTGRVYRVNKGKTKGRNLREKRRRIGKLVGGFHRASAPGFPPAVNTNRLRSSWSVSGTNQRNPDGGYAFIFRAISAFVLEYGSTLKYAPFLEYGNRRFRVNFEPRPYLRPILPIATPKIGTIFEKALARQFGDTR